MDLFKDDIFNNDVLYMKSLVGRSVKISTIDEKSFTGIVYVIDPIYKTIVLHTRETDSNKHDTVFILHHAIKSLDLLSDSIEMNYLEQKEPAYDSEELATEKQRLKKWFQQMYINVDEVGEYLKIDNDLLIMPPYGLNNCISNNTIILEKIRTIIGLIPEDFK